MTIHTDDFALPPGEPAPRVVSAAAASAREEALERALRPKQLEEYVGQAKAREQLEIFIGAARKRGEALDHVLLRNGWQPPPSPWLSLLWLLLLLL